MAKSVKENLERFYKDAEDNVVLKMRRSGKSCQYIAEFYGVSRVTVQRYARVEPKRIRKATKEPEFQLTPLRRFALCGQWK